MDSLTEIIKTFSEEDCKEFKAFVNRQRKISHRKDYELFSTLQKNPDSKQEEIIQSVYKINNVEAYHGLRKSLTRQLTQFIMIKQLQNDQSSASAISGLLSLSRYLFENKSYKIAWKYLKKAEEQALTNELYELLQQVYNLQIAFAESPYAPELKEIIRKHRENKILAEQDERSSLAFSIIKSRLLNYRKTGKSIPFDEIIKQILDSYDLNQDFYSRPKLFYQVMTVFRSSIIARKDYYSFEPFIIGNYQKFLKKTGFKPKDNEYRASILYMIAQTLYRNKKFEESKAYSAQLKDVIEQMPQTLKNDFLVKHSMLSAANNFFTGKIIEAIQILESIARTPSLNKNLQDSLNLKLNISFYKLYANENHDANKILLTISHTNKWCEKIMGIEWVLKKDLLEMIIQFELNNDDLALNKIRSIERTYNIIKDHEQYQRVLVYLQLCREIFSDPEVATSTKFMDKVEQSFDWIPMQQEDLQAVMYYAWFKSKITGKDRYETLLELAQLIN
jgi:hypothetical protein